MKQPNIVFIMADDLGHWALGHAGTPEIHTPNIDRLAKNSIRFEHFFCASPVCSPARASLLTGAIPSYHGVHDWIRSGNVDKEKFKAQGKKNPYGGGYADEKKPIQYLKGLTTYTELLAAHGYTCALSGKWHLGDSITPQKGFSKDHWYTLGKGGAFYYHPDIVENGTITIKEGEYLTDAITDKAIAYIEEFTEKKEPFYLSVHYTAPHSPWEWDQHPEEYIDYYKDNPFASIPDVPDHPDGVTGAVYGTPKRQENLVGYAAAISAMDFQIGRLLSQLESTGLRDNTLVIFTSDNGMNMGHHGIWGKGNGTYPQNMYDTSVKVPFLFSPPLPQKGSTKYPVGQISQRLTSAYDVFPSLLEFAGIPLPPALAKTLPGRSFLPALRGEEAPEKAVVVFDEYGPVRMIRTATEKYIHRYPYGPHEYYDLTTDPEELDNKVNTPEAAPRIIALRQELFQWFSTYMDPAKDGTKEGVTGLGQMTLAGAAADQLHPYYPQDSKDKQ